MKEYKLNGTQDFMDNALTTEDQAVCAPDFAEIPLVLSIHLA